MTYRFQRLSPRVSSRLLVASRPSSRSPLVARFRTVALPRALSDVCRVPLTRSRVPPPLVDAYTRVSPLPREFDRPYLLKHVGKHRDERRGGANYRLDASETNEREILHEKIFNSMHFLFGRLIRPSCTGWTDFNNILTQRLIAVISKNWLKIDGELSIKELVHDETRAR